MLNNTASVAVIVLNWNDSKQAIECLESLYHIDYDKYDIILVDNNSENHHIDIIHKWSKNEIRIEHPLIDFDDQKKITIELKDKNEILNKDDIGKKKYYLIKNKINLGCTGGFNVGYNFAIQNNYKYIARFDNDTVASKNHLKVLINQLENDKSIAAICAKANYKQMPDKVSWAGMKIGNNLKFHRMMRINTRKDPDKKWIGLHESDAVNGPGSIYRSEILTKTGLADEDFFYGPEDVELCQRIRRYGKTMVNCDVRVYHEVAKSASINGEKKRTYMEHKSFLLLIKKIGTFWDKAFGYSYGFLRLFFYIFFLTDKVYRIRLLSSSKAFLDFLLGNYGKYDKDKINSKEFLN